jgi:hypothetical protein
LAADGHVIVGAVRNQAFLQTLLAFAPSLSRQIVVSIPSCLLPASFPLRLRQTVSLFRS